MTINRKLRALQARRHAWRRRFNNRLSAASHYLVWALLASMLMFITWINHAH